ncbi:MAG: peptidoglycan glycosyltransferase [Clostridia bacterium]|nr:peptidoglycan glycosyltransferase [Clostridia bacterium]
MNNKRAMYMLAVFCFIFLTLIGYMTYTEIRHNEEYNSVSHNLRIKLKDKSVIRGSIYDRNNLELAYSEKVEGDIFRRYPYENLYSHVIGYVSKDYVNKTLLEEKYNTNLLGNNPVNKFTNIINSLKNSNTKGDDLYLTIDHELQKAAYNAMGNHDGSIVALDVKTGAVLAMVSKPDYNPADEKFMENLKDTALYSRAIQFNYPPGSTFKTVTTASIIENGLENEEYNDKNGQYVIKSGDGNSRNDYICRNEYAKYSYGITDLEKAFTVSSNVYFAHLSTMLSSNKLRSTAEKFMFNKTIEFDLPVKKSTFQEGNMTDAEKVMASIGQGKTEATPLHMALVTATIANNGVMPKPHLVSEIRSGSIVVYKASESDLGQVISEQTANQIKDYMRNVVTSGTGKSAALPNIEVCGKTGTSENALTAQGGKNAGKTHSLFIGFAPYDNPQIAVCVIMEYAGFGATYAAPAAKAVMQKYFELN